MNVAVEVRMEDEKGNVAHFSGCTNIDRVASIIQAFESIGYKKMTWDMNTNHYTNRRAKELSEADKVIQPEPIYGLPGLT